MEEAEAVGGDALRKAEEELDKLMANHTLHFKPEKQEEFLVKRGRKKPNKESRSRSRKQSVRMKALSIITPDGQEAGHEPGGL